jgi:putative transposase
MDALARWRILRLHVEDAIPLTVLAQETDVGLRTLQRWKKAYRAGGIDAPARRAGRSRNATHGAGAGGVH